MYTEVFKEHQLQSHCGLDKEKQYLGPQRKEPRLSPQDFFPQRNLYCSKYNICPSLSPNGPLRPVPAIDFGIFFKHQSNEGNCGNNMVQCCLSDSWNPVPSFMFVSKRVQRALKMNFIVPIRSINFCSLHAVPLVLHLGALATVVYAARVVAPAITYGSYCTAAMPDWHFMGKFISLPVLACAPGQPFSSGLLGPSTGQNQSLFPSPLLRTPSLSPILPLSTEHFLCQFANSPSDAIVSHRLCQDANSLPQSQVLKGRMIISLLLPKPQRRFCSQKGSLTSTLPDQSVPASPGSSHYLSQATSRSKSMATIQMQYE